jgi:hypothetical protein
MESLRRQKRKRTKLLRRTLKQKTNSNFGSPLKPTYRQTQLKQTLSKPNKHNKHMKHTKSILVAALAVAAIGSASAAVTNNVPRNQFFIAGSTALRHVTMPTIYNYAVGDQGYSLQCADSTLVGTIGNNPKVALFSKEISRVTNAKSGDVTVTKDYINVHMIGSEGGTLVTGSKNVQGFAPLNAVSITEAGCTNSNSATITFSDVDQAAGNFTGAKGAWAKVAKLTEVGQIAAINFTFVASSNFPAASWASAN